MLSKQHVLLVLLCGTLSYALRGNSKVVTVDPSGKMTAASDVDPYKSSSFIGHSLWMCPSGYAKEAYSSIISETSFELGGTLQFKPHITLVAAMMTGAEDVVERTKALAAELAPYQFEFDQISQRDAYFQCAFAKMKRSKGVMAANALAREFFPERKADPGYMPHLSLVYGDFDLVEKESEIIPELRRKLAEKARYTKSFTVDAIEVWSTQGDAKDWYLVETVPLQGNIRASN
jgi:2'-5' RNA ligase